MDQELEAFKTGIDLRAYAASCGYTLDRKESWRGSAVMRKAGDKIVVRCASDGHYVYFSVRDDRDNGSIIDFVRNRKALSLGAVRKELRPWIGRDSAGLPELPPLQYTARDRLAVERNYRRMSELRRHAYLEDERGLPARLFASRRFVGRMRCDAKGNAVFPHFDREGICGYEIRNRSFTGFAKGGAKGLWLSHEEDLDHRLVVCESAIDALSHAALFPDARARYASTGGQMSVRQPGLIAALIERMPEGAEMVAAMDADDAGRGLALMIRQFFNAAAGVGRADLRFTLEEPEGAKDWNDLLRAGRTASIPAAPTPVL